MRSFLIKDPLNVTDYHKQTTHRHRHDDHQYIRNGSAHSEKVDALITNAANAKLDAKCTR